MLTGFADLLKCHHAPHDIPRFREEDPLVAIRRVVRAADAAVKYQAILDYAVTFIPYYGELGRDGHFTIQERENISIGSKLFDKA